MKTKTTRSRAGMIVTVLLLSFWTAMAAPLPVSSIQPTNNEYTESFTSTTAPTGWSHGQFMTSDNWTYGTPSGAIPSTYGRGWYRNETAKSPSLPLTEWSYVDFPAFDFSNFVFDPVVDLDIFYNTTSGYGMRLAYTTDNINWFPVGGLNDQDVYAENWYNTAVMNFMGGPGWSGNSNGWIDAVHTLTGLAGESYVDFRMYFVGGSNADVVAFDNLHIFESFGVAITSDATQVSDDPGFSIQNGECITLKAEVYGNVPVTSIHWYSMTADQVSVNSWWCDHMYSIGAAMGCFFNAPPYSGNVSSWTCDLVGTGDSINVCPDSSTFYYAVINNGSFMPCQGIATAWPFMPGFWYDPSNFGPLPPKGGPTWVYAGSAVAVIDPLEVEAEYDGFTVCDTATTPLFAFATGGVPPYTYAWSPTTNLAPTNTAVVYSTTNNNIVYTVTVTDALGNTATDDVDISVVSGYPFVDIVPNNVLLCEGQSATLSAYGGSTWNWYVVPSGAATFSATNTVTTEITATGTHASFQVFCDLTSSCGPATAFMTVNVSPTPAAPTFLNAGPYEVCSTDPLIDLAASLQPSPAGGTFSGPGVYNGFFDPSHAASLPFTTYTLYYTIESANGCQAVDSFNVQVWPSSTPFLFTVGPDTVCLNDVTVHVAGFLPGALIQVNWTVDGGNILNVFGPDSTAVQIEWTTVGSGQIRAEYVGAYCTNYDTFDVVVNPLPVFSIKSNEGVVAVSDTFIYCEEDVDSLYADIIPGLGTGFGGYAVDWTIYNGIGTGSPVASYTNVYGLPESPAYNPNAYPTVQYWTVTATLLDSSTGCYAYDTAYVKVFPLPEPEIMAQGPDADTLFICANECGKVYEANDYDSYVWFVDGTKVAETSDTLEVCGADFTAPDTFEIMVIAFSADGCSDTAYIDAVVWVTPTPFALMNDGDLTFCWNTTGPELYLDSSQVGINYQLYRDGATVGAPLAGDGDSITWGNFNIPGDYYVHAVNTVTGCEDWMLDTLTLVSDTIVIDLLSEFSQVCEDFTSRMTVDFTPSDTTGYGPFTFDWDPDAKFTPDGYGTGLALPGDVDTWYYVTVIGTDPLCQATDSFFLTVLQGPEPSIGDSANSIAKVSDTTICLFSSIDLQVSWVLGDAAVTSVVWSPLTEITPGAINGNIAGVNIAATAPRTYSVTVTDANGCTGVDSVNVFVSAAPIVNINNNVPASVCPGYDTTLTANVPFGTGPFTYTWSTTETTASINVTPAATTTYYVTVFDAGLGCYGYDSITVEVYAAPTIDMNGPYQSCIWGEINFNPIVTASPAIVNIAWSESPSNPTTGLSIANTINPTVTLAGVNNGIYTFYLEVTDANGCVAEDSVNVTVTPGPSISAGADQYICEGTTVQLAGSGGGTYAWFDAPGYDSLNLIATTAYVSVTPLTTTTYYLRVNHDSCGPAVSQVTVYVHPATPVFFDGLGTSYCEVDGPVTLTNISPLGGTWSGEGVVNGVFYPTNVTTLDAPITITYTYADSSAYPLYPVCEYEHSMTTTVWSNPTVTIGTVAPVCADAASFPVTNFNGMPAGGTYEINGVATVTVNPATLGAGTHNVWYFYTNVHGCTDSASTTFTVWPLPIKQQLFAVSPTNGGHFCDGDSAEIYMNASEADVVYDLYLDGGIVTFYNVATVNGTGGYLSFGKFAGDGDYYVIGTKMVTGCTDVASDTVTLIKEERPQQYNLIVSNGGHYCEDGACETGPCTGVQIGMYATNPEDRYDLYKKGSPDVLVATMMGNAISGTGQWFPGTFTAGQYYVIAYDISTPANCPKEMLDVVTVTMDPKPLVKTLTKNNVCQCPHESTIISIVGSAEPTVYYVLYDPSMNPVDTITGTTSFAPVKPVGIYTVIAYKPSNGTNPWYFGSSLLPNGNWSTVCVRNLGTIEVCEYIYASVDALRTNDLTPATPHSLTIDGGDEAYLAVDVTVDSQPHSFQWQMSTTGGSTWVNVPATAPYYGATTDSLWIDPVAYPSMKGYKFRFVVFAHCGNDTSDVITLEVRPEVSVYAGMPILPKGPSTYNGADSVQCSNDIVIPIYAEHLDSLGSLSLSFLFDYMQMQLDTSVGTGLSKGFTNIHPLLAPSFQGGTSAAGRISFGAFSINPINLGPSAVLCNIHFKMGNNGGFSLLEWDLLTGGACQITSPDPYDLKVHYFDGQVRGLKLPVPNVNIMPNPICEGDVLTLDASPYSPEMDPDGNPVAGYWVLPNAARGVAGYIFADDTTFTAVLADEGTYSYFVTDNNGCAHDTSFFVQVNPLPELFNVIGGGEACVGGAVEIGLDGSQVGVKYYLMYNGNVWHPAGYPAYVINGTGDSITFGPVSLGNQVLGTHVFTVMAIDTTEPTMCDIYMDGYATVKIDPVPFAFDLRVIDNGLAVISGDYCEGTGGLPVRLTGSQIGVRYELWYAPYCCNCPDTMITAVNGTGSQISFGYQTLPGYYHVRAYYYQTNTMCDNYMKNCVYISINPLPTATISGTASICYGQSTNLTLNFTGKAPFTAVINGVTYNTMTSSLVIPVSPLSTTTYYVNSVTDANGCVQTYTTLGVTVTVNPLPNADASYFMSTPCVGQTLQLSALPGAMSYQWSGPNSFTSSLQNPVINNVTTANAGTYYLTVTNTVTGCVNYDNVTVNIYSLPVAYATGDVVCVGDMIDISGQYSYSTSSASIVDYIWSGPAGFASGAADTTFGPATLAMGGTYSLTVVDSYGCMASTTTTVTVHALPVANAGQDVEICFGDTTTLTGNGGDAYIWSDGVSTWNTQSIAVAPAYTTTYYLTVIDHHGQVSCEDYDTVEVTVNPLPEPYVLTRDGIYCFGCFGIPVNLVYSDSTVNYVLYWKDLQSGSTWVAVDTLLGVNDTLYFGDLEVPGYYKVLGVNVLTGCENWMSNEILIGTRPAPTVSINDIDVCADACEDMLVTLTGLPPFKIHYTTGVVETFNTGDLTYVGLVNNIETWTYTIQICGSSAPAYIGIDLVEDSVCFRNGDTAMVEVLPLPTVYDVNGGGYYCNIGIPVGLAGSQLNVSYVLYLNSNPIDTIAGTGAALTFGPQTQVGMYTVLAVNDVTGCDEYMNGYAEITSGTLPTVYNVYGDGFYCAGDSSEIWMNYSQVGVTYELLLFGISTGVQVDGTGGQISFGHVTVPGEYTVQGIDDVTHCISLMNGTILVGIRPLPTANVSGNATICKGQSSLITVTLTGTPPFYFSMNGVGYTTNNYVWTQNFAPLTTTTYTVSVVEDLYCDNTGGSSATITVSLPTPYTITGGGVYCAGDAGKVVGLNGSQNGVTYALYVNGVATGQTMAGTGAAISFGLQTAAGVYSIIGTIDANQCTGPMTGTVTISINPLPTVYNVTGGGECCLGCTVLYVGLDDTENNPNIRYELWRNGVLYNNALFPPKYGTGNAIQWGYMTQAGTYTIRAVNEVTGCATFMNSSAVCYFYPIPAANISGGGTVCEGEPVSFTVNFTAGTAPFSVLVYENSDTLQYFTGIMSNTFTYTTSSLAAGTYTYQIVEVADSLCFNTATGSVSITVNPLPTVSLNYLPSDYCVDAPADTLDMGMPGMGSYTIDGVAATWFDAAALGVGSHTVVYTYTNSNGCTNSVSKVVDVNALPTCDVTGGTYCIDAQSFALTTGTPAGGVYYVNGVVATSFNPASYGVGAHALTYVYTDGNGCVCTSVDTIYVINLPNVSITPVPALCANGSAVTLVGSPAGGVFSGTGVVGNTFDPTLVTPGASYTISYAISVGVCANTATTSIYVNVLPADVNMSGDTLVCEYTNQEVFLDATQAGITYQLYRNGNIINGQLLTGTGNPMSFGVQSQPGVYTAYAYNPATGCGRFLTDDVTISWIPLPTVATVGNGTHCIGESTSVTFNFTGTPPFTLEYKANGVDYSVSGIMGYSYVLNFTNLQNNIAITDVSIIDVTCYNDGNDVFITVLPSTATFNVTGGGSYCAGSAGVAVGLDNSTSGVIYVLYKNGIATTNAVVGTGSAISFGPQTAGTYTVVATGAGNCQTTMVGSVLVSEIAVPTVGIAGDNSICEGEQVTLTASGATSYTWNTGATTAAISVSPTTTTTYYVTGTNGTCDATASFTVVVNSLPTVTIDPVNASICLGTDVDLTASGAVSYVWNTGATTASINVIPTGTTTYYVTGTNAAGCTDVAMVEVVVFTNPTLSIAPSAPAICVGDDVTLTASGATSFVWNNGDLTAATTVAPTTTTTYTVTGTVAGGCTATASVTVTVNALPTVNAGTDVTICQGASTMLTATGTATSYVWTGLSGNPTTVTPSVTTTYTVVGTNAAGCTAADQVTVTVAAPQAVDAGANQTITAGNSATLTASVTGGSGSFGYLWTPGNLTGASVVVSPTSNTTYTVVVTDLVSGCVVSDNVTVEVISVIGNIAGNVTYKNAAGTPMSNTPVVLYNGSTVVASTTTDANGDYTFSNVYGGNYTVVAQPNKAWGGGNSNDALLILKHFSNIPPALTGLNLAAANPNATGGVNATDALLVAQRFVNLITSFAGGNWVSDAAPVTISVAGTVSGVDVQVLCMGDVNGSFTPAAKATVNVINSGVMELKSFETIELPVSVSKEMTVGAISLVLDYPVDAVEVEGVLLGTEASSSLLYTDNNGELRISWYNTTARQLNAGEALVTLKLRVKDLNYLLSESIEISTNAESQLGDVNAQVYENVSLVVPKLTVAVEEYAISNFPNPFNEATQFEYSLPEAGTVSLKVFNMLGEQVSALVNNLPQEAGNYKVEFRAVNLTPGNYTYRFEVQGESRQFSKTGVMVLTR